MGANPPPEGEGNTEEPRRASAPAIPGGDAKPSWYQAMETAFDLLLRGVAWTFWFWGLGIFLLILYGFWLLMIGDPP